MELYNTSAPEFGRIAVEAKPRKLVLYHLLAMHRAREQIQKLARQDRLGRGTERERAVADAARSHGFFLRLEMHACGRPLSLQPAGGLIKRHSVYH